MKQPEVGSPDDRLRADVVTAAQLYHALRARLPLILGIAVAAALAAAVIVFMVTPRFTSEAQLLLESRESVYTRALGERELPGGVFDEQAVASQVQVISSRDVAREVIRRLGLVGNPEFDPLMGPMDPITRVRMMLGASRGVFGGAEEERIFDSYYSRLTVFPVARSRVVAIRFASADPDLAARAANTIAQVYLEQLEEAKTDMARAASTWLGTSIEDLRDRVSSAEASVEEFRARSGLLVGGNNATITSQQLSDINTELAQARSAQADAQARARLISDMIAGGRAFEIPDVANNETIVRLLEQRVNLRSQMALEQRTLLPQHPRILELRAQLVDLDAEIAAAAERTVRILENDARLAGARVESLEAALEAQMRVVAQAN
jgi:polysaccharide biosynthesis transport protein